MPERTAYIAPDINLDAFNCPACGVYVRQFNGMMRGLYNDGLVYGEEQFFITRCARCQFPTIWHGQRMIYPMHLTAEPPHCDMPADMRVDYEEARAVFNQSPRSAAALLRLAIQKLCKHLGQPGKNINNDIKALVAGGLPVVIQQALDIVRIVGNNAVHPGELDITDNRETANGLFKLVNFIVEKAISEPKQIAEMFSGMPANALQGIRDRDGT